jgi:uncharacterized oligopeptide transporter (OPT) family protein
MIKRILFFVISVFVTFLVTTLVAVINSYMFLDSIIDEKVKERFNAGQIALDQTIKQQQATIDLKWPLSSIIFFVFVMSLYWFFYGRITKIYLPTYPIVMIVLLPVIYSLFVQDFYFMPLYFLVCLLGLKSTNFKRA